MNSGARGTPPSATTTTTTSNSPGTLGAAGSAGTTAGTSISGTSSGDAFSGSSRGNVPPVGAAAGTNTTAAGTNTTFTNNLDRNATGAIFNANGERIGTAIVNPDTGFIVNDTTAATTASVGSVNSASIAVTSTPELDKAARREAQHQRRTVERKGQMMQSIAPRSNVDRTDQMPDDSTPLLSPSRR
jgi:hypothetical protein